MLDLIKEAVSKVQGRELKIHAVREFLQLAMLKILYDRGCFTNLAFVGGTAVRFLHGLRRYSEDLDFSLILKEGYKPDVLMGKVAYDMEKAGFSLDVKRNLSTAIHSAMFKFKGLLFFLELSNRREEKLSIKVEVDSNPPAGWNTEVSLISKYFVFTVTHFDLPSLYAQKLHACFFRKYTKGRDFYDLLWYLGKKTAPNFGLLNNAIEQTERNKLHVNEANFQDFFKEHLARIDFAVVRKDVERFIQDKNGLKLLDKDTILELIDHRVAPK